MGLHLRVIIVIYNRTNYRVQKSDLTYRIITLIYEVHIHISILVINRYCSINIQIARTEP